MAGNGHTKFGGRHYSLDSPGSLSSPPGYDVPMMDQKPTVAALSMPNCTGPAMSCSPPFSQINPHLIYSPTAQTGLLPLSKLHIHYTCIYMYMVQKMMVFDIMFHFRSFISYSACTKHSCWYVSTPSCWSHANNGHQPL